MEKISFYSFVKNVSYYWYELNEPITLENASVYIECDICFVINNKELFNKVKEIVINCHIDYIEHDGKLYFDSCNPAYLSHLSDYQLRSHYLFNLYRRYKNHN